MSDKSRLDRVYAQLLRDHPYGWALYKKVTTQEIHPGSCGYFDPEGDWQTITDLTNSDHLIKQGWSVPDDRINPKTPQPLTWGPKKSNSVRSHNVGGTVGANVAAAPVEASAKMTFESSSDQGAVLATEHPVLKHQLGDESSALRWMAENTTQIVRQYKDIVKRHGIWIVTKTYTTRRCAIAMMTKASSSVEIGLGAEVPGVLTLKPNSTWSNSGGSSSLELHEDDDGVVVFISGIYFSSKIFGSGLNHSRDQHKQKDKILREAPADEDLSLDIEFYAAFDEEEEGNGETEEEDR